eukprot:scaffold42466_cov42-Cyclotella_meneghiniana.AAC.1
MADFVPSAPDATAPTCVEGCYELVWQVISYTTKPMPLTSDKPVYASDPRLIIPANSKLRASPLFTNPRILALKQHVTIAMPLESHYKYFSPASGIPPYVMIYAYIKSLDVTVDNMPQKFEAMLDRRQMAGPLSLDQIAQAVENGPRITAIANDIAAEKSDSRKRCCMSKQ